MIRVMANWVYVFTDNEATEGGKRVYVANSLLLHPKIAPYYNRLIPVLTDLPNYATFHSRVRKDGGVYIQVHSKRGRFVSHEYVAINNKLATFKGIISTLSYKPQLGVFTINLKLKQF